MKHTLRKSLLAALVMLVAFSACRRIKNNNNDDASYLASDQALSEWTYNDVLNMADEASTLNTGDPLQNYKTTSNCATITHDTNSTPRLITIDFGSVNCLCNDGRYRRGKIYVSYTGKYKDAGHTHTISFDQYFVNDNQVLGTKSVQNMGLNAQNQMYYNVTVNGLILKAQTGDSIIWNSNRTRTFIQGESTPTRLDDVYEISGSGSGSRPNGVSYTMNITQPLVKEIGCKWFKSGEIQLQPSNKPLRTINYGNGACDNQATVTINGTTYNITLN